MDVSQIILIFGVLVFLVGVITEVVKNVGVFKKVPTDLFVLVLSITLTVTAFVAYMQYIHQKIIWYMILAAIIAGFIVAFIAMFGWEKLMALWSRARKDDSGGK